MFDFLSIKNSLASLQNQHNELCQQQRQVQQTRSQIVAARANKVDLRAAVDLWIKKSASKFNSAVASHMHANFRTGTNGAGDVGFLSLMKNASGELSVEAMDSAMCAVFGDQIRKTISAAIDQMDWSDEGLPRDKRAIEVERLLMLDQKLEGDIQELRKGADESGLFIR